MQRMHKRNKEKWRVGWLFSGRQIQSIFVAVNISLITIRKFSRPSLSPRVHTAAQLKRNRDSNPIEIAVQPLPWRRSSFSFYTNRIASIRWPPLFLPRDCCAPVE